MTATPKTRVLCIGHPYVLAINRSVERELARDPAFEVTVAAPEKFHGDLRPLVLEPELPDSPLRVVSLGVGGSRVVHLFRFDGRALRDLLRTGEFDVVYAWAEPYILVGWQIARAVRRFGGERARFVFRTAQNLRKDYPWPFGWFEKQCVARAQGWMACGQLVFDTMVERGYSPGRGRMIPLAVDTTAFRPPSPAGKAEVLAELGLRVPVVGYLGRLVASKGIGVLCQALERLPSTQAWSLLCLGSGPEETAILTWAREHGWQDRVRVRLAKHHEVPRYLGAMDLLAAPSQTTPRWKEQFGRMVIEAFASGVPVIGSDSGEIPHVIGPAGRIVPEADVEAWAQAIADWLAHSDRRASFGALGRVRAERYSARGIVGEYREFFSTLAREPVTEMDRIT